MSPEQLSAVSALVAGNPEIVALRSAFPELIFTECSENDISPRIKPVVTLPQYLLYLVTGASGHCLELTSDLESANGVVIAARDDDEE
jgi:hypothetical protein